MSLYYDFLYMDTKVSNIMASKKFKILSETCALWLNMHTMPKQIVVLLVQTYNWLLDADIHVQTKRMNAREDFID